MVTPVDVMTGDDREVDSSSHSGSAPSSLAAASLHRSDSPPASAKHVSRSILPHEPLPKNESEGFLHLQGSFELKKCKKEEDKGGCNNVTTSSHWTRDSNAFHEALSSSPVLQKAQGLATIQLIDTNPPFTKVRLVFDNPEKALAALQTWRRNKLSAHDILSSPSSPETFSTRQLQITQITYQPMLPTHLAWTRSNPPKFRRILRSDSHSVSSSLDEERAAA